METFVKGAVKNHIEYGQKRRSKVRAMANFLTDTNKIRGLVLELSVKIECFLEFSDAVEIPSCTLS